MFVFKTFFRISGRVKFFYNAKLYASFDKKAMQESYLTTRITVTKFK